MKNKHLFEQFMKENGIGYGVPFKAQNRTKVNSIVIYKNGIDLLVYYNKHELNCKENLSYIRAIISDLMFDEDTTIIRKPWKPKDGEGYSYVWWFNDKELEGIVGRDIWENRSEDFTRYIIGNCFKTEKEATEHKDDVARVLRGEPFVKWEE